MPLHTFFTVDAHTSGHPVGLSFIETSGCLPKCGHGTIGTVTVMVEHGLARLRHPGVVHLDTLPGR